MNIYTFHLATAGTVSALTIFKKVDTLRCNLLFPLNQKVTTSEWVSVSDSTECISISAGPCHCLAIL